MVAKTKRQRTWMKIAGLVDVASSKARRLNSIAAHTVARSETLSEAGAALDVPFALVPVGKLNLAGN